MRLIDADAFRREIDNHWPFTMEEQSKHGIADMAKSTLLYVLNTMPTIEPEPHWIPCSERPPKEGHDVLITKESFKIKGYEQKVIKAKRSVDPRSGKIEWWSPEFGALTNKAVLAWMPLPAPYRKDGGKQ